jgi:hypothetical protein
MTDKTEEQLDAEEMATFINPVEVEPEPEEITETSDKSKDLSAESAVEEISELEIAESDLKDPEQEPEEETDKKSVNRFTKQTRELRETQRQLKAIQEQLAALTAEKTTPLTPEKSDDKAEIVEGPNPEKYRYGELDPQFIRDTASHEARIQIERALAAQKAEIATSQQEAARQAEVVKLQQKATEIETLGASKFEDFVEVVTRGAENGDYPLTREMFELAIETEVAPDILYYLAKNPDEAEQVSEMPSRKQALWFGRLEAKLAAKQPRKGTLAPVPISSARGRGATVSTPAATTDFAAFERAAMSRG